MSGSLTARKPSERVDRHLNRALVSFVRRRAPLVAAVLLVVCNAAGVGIYLARSTGNAPVAAAPETPSWRLESSSGSLETTGPTQGPRSVREVAAAPVEASENITPELVRQGNKSPCPSQPPVVVSAKDFGARGDGITDDTKAVQRTINAVAARGGGRVLFPAGKYRLMGVQQDSCVQLQGSGDATLIHDAASTTSMIEGRVFATRGSIGRNSRVLRVKSTRGILRGSIVAVQGGQGRSTAQQTKLTQALLPHMESAAVEDATGLQTKWTNYLFVGEEIISYNGVKSRTLLNVQRGLLGTPHMKHDLGTAVSQAHRMFAVVLDVSGNRITLDSISRVKVVDAQVWTGSVGMEVSALSIDGNRHVDGARSNSIQYRLARWAGVRDSRFSGGNHAAISLDMSTRNSVVERNMISDYGYPRQKLGVGISVFRGSTSNLLRGNTVSGDTFVGVLIDDRTEESTEFDADSSRNVIEGNTVTISRYAYEMNAGILIAGSSRTKATSNRISGPYTGIVVATSPQGKPMPRIAYFARVANNTLEDHAIGLLVSGSDNEFLRNVIHRSSTPWSDLGRRNRFIENIYD